MGLTVRRWVSRAALVALVGSIVVGVDDRPAQANPIGFSGTVNHTDQFVYVFEDWKFDEGGGSVIDDRTRPYSRLSGGWLAPHETTPVIQDWDGFQLRRGCRLEWHMLDLVTLTPWDPPRTPQSTLDYRYASHGLFIKVPSDRKAVLTRLDCVTAPPVWFGDTKRGSRGRKQAALGQWHRCGQRRRSTLAVAPSGPM